MANHDHARLLELSDLREVMKTAEGRRVLWRFLEKANPFQPIWEASARIHYNSGQQEFGQFIMSEMEQANMELFFLAWRENKKEPQEMKS